jgi:hypothetical protein
MIFVKIFESYDAVAWRKLISKLNGTPFHLPEIWTVGVNHDSLRYLIWEENDTPVAASIGIVEKRRFLKFVDRGAGLRLPTAPVLGEKFSILREELYIALQRECMDHGYRGVIVDSRWGEDPGVADRLGLSAVFPLVEFLVDLTQGEENLLRTMHKKHRKNIRLAQESGVSIENSISVDDFLCLQSMQQSSADRSAEKGNLYEIQGKNFYIESYDKIYCNGPGKVLFARKNGDNIAALAYLSFGDKAVTVRSGSTKFGYEISAMYLLQFELFKILAKAGLSQINIGGVPSESVDSKHPQHGLYNYKRYYGGIPRVCAGFTLTMDRYGKDR